MPIYEYACGKCGHEFEKLVRSDTILDCPSCHSTELEKKLSVFATAVSSTKATPAPAACGSCGNFGGPGCGLN